LLLAENNALKAQLDLLKALGRTNSPLDPSSPSSLVTSTVKAGPVSAIPASVSPLPVSVIDHPPSLDRAVSSSSLAMVVASAVPPVDSLCNSPPAHRAGKSPSAGAPASSGAAAGTASSLKFPFSPMCGADINALFAQWGLVPSIDSARVNEAIEQFKIIDLHQFASFINELSSAFNNLDMEQLGNSLVIHESSSLEY
jgi:hypothetical protein